MQLEKFAWLDTTEYPFEHRFLQIQGHRLHYIDQGEGEPIVFVHGTPSWSFDFRHQIKNLSTKYRCIALDHIGFGLSDKPADYTYNTQNHAKNLYLLLQHLNLSSFTLVVHDFGGPIGFEVALANPEKIKNIVVLNSWLWDCSNEKGYQEARKILKSPLLPFLYRFLNFSPSYLLPYSFADKSKLTKKLHRQYTLPFSRPSERYGTLAFARSLLNDQAYFGKLWEQLPALSNKPTLFIWGMGDKFVVPSYLEKFSSAFPSAKVVKLEACGHFPQEERKEEVLDAIQQFMAAQKKASI